MHRVIVRVVSVAGAAVLGWVAALVVLSLISGTGRIAGGYEALVILVAAVVVVEVWAWRRTTRWLDRARPSRDPGPAVATTR